MRWLPRILGAVLLAALMTQPALAVVVNLPIIDRQGNPLPGLTISSSWGRGKTTTLTTDATGRLRGEVPEGTHFCSLWDGALHLASGLCNLTDNLVQQSATAAQERTGTTRTSSQPGKSIGPPPTAAEKAASSAVDQEDSMTMKTRITRAAGNLFWAPHESQQTPGNWLIALSKYKMGEGGGVFGVMLAQLFSLDGSGGDDDGGNDGGSN
jgi:hypothetical protein